MRSIFPVLAAALVLLCAAAGCGAATAPEDDSGRLLLLADTVDMGGMMATVRYLAGDGLQGRPAGSPASRELESYLESTLRELGLQPVGHLGLDGYRQEFQVPAERCFLEEIHPPNTAITCANILGEIPGTSQTEMIVLTANYDGMGRDAETGAVYPGADYNASGAAAVLELARVFAEREEEPRATLVFALLGAEECGGYGSGALADSLQAEGLGQVVRIINLEGLGAGDGDYMDVWDLNYRKNRASVEAIDSAAALLGVELELGGADPGTSASTFFLYHLPAVTCDWSWFERSEHPDFHLLTDTADKIDGEGMLKVTRVVAVAVEKLGG